MWFLVGKLILSGVLFYTLAEGNFLNQPNLALVGPLLSANRSCLNDNPQSSLATSLSNSGVSSVISTVTPSGIPGPSACPSAIIASMPHLARKRGEDLGHDRCGYRGYIPRFDHGQIPSFYAGGFTTTSSAISGAPSAILSSPPLIPTSAEENTPTRFFRTGLIVATYSKERKIQSRRRISSMGCRRHGTLQGIQAPDGPSDLNLFCTILEELYTASQMAGAISADDSEWIRWDANDGPAAQCRVDVWAQITARAPVYLVDYAATIGGKRIVACVPGG
ncbi:hypothetical protein B0H13DRAFT_1890248 [Mycena leptocephala]|nr:hypothetical protein B0H13DRAFT_1890248 [Mycena leptocephala]